MTTSSLELDIIEQQRRAEQRAAQEAALAAAQEFQEAYRSDQPGGGLTPGQAELFAQRGVSPDTIARYTGYQTGVAQSQAAGRSTLAQQFAQGQITLEQASQQYGAAAAEKAAQEAIQARQTGIAAQSEQRAIEAEAALDNAGLIVRDTNGVIVGIRTSQAVRILGEQPLIDIGLSDAQIAQAKRESARELRLDRPAYQGAMGELDAGLAIARGANPLDLVAQGFDPSQMQALSDLRQLRLLDNAGQINISEANRLGQLELVRAAGVPDEFLAQTLFAGQAAQARQAAVQAGIAERLGFLEAYRLPSGQYDLSAAVRDLPTDFLLEFFSQDAIEAAQQGNVTADLANTDAIALVQGLGPEPEYSRGELEFAASQDPEALRFQAAVDAVAPYANTDGTFRLDDAARDLPVGILIDRGFAAEDIDAALERNAQLDALTAQAQRRAALPLTAELPVPTASGIPLAQPEFVGPRSTGAGNIWQRIGLVASDEYRRERAAEGALRTDEAKRAESEVLLQAFGVDPREATIIANSDDPVIQEVIKSDLLGYVPVVGVTYNWQRLSPAERAFQIALDTATILSLVGGPTLKGLSAARAARTLPEINRAATLVRTQDAALTRYVQSAAIATPELEAPVRSLATASTRYANDIARIAALEKDLAAAETRAIRGAAATGRDVSRTYAQEVTAIQDALENAKTSAIQGEVELLNAGDDFYNQALKLGPRADDPLLRQELRDSLSGLPRAIRANVQEELLPVTLKQRVIESPPAQMIAETSPARIADLKQRVATVSQRLDAARQRYPTDPGRWADISADKLSIEAQLIEAQRGGLAQMGRDVQSLKFEATALRNASRTAATAGERLAILTRLADVDNQYQALRQQFLTRLRDLEDTLEGRGLNWDFDTGGPRAPLPTGGGSVITAPSAPAVIAPRGYSFQEFRPQLLQAADISAQRAQAFLTPGEIAVALELGRAIPAGYTGDLQGIALTREQRELEQGRIEGAVEAPERTEPPVIKPEPRRTPGPRRVAPTTPPRRAPEPPPEPVIVEPPTREPARPFVVPAAPEIVPLRPLEPAIGVPIVEPLPAPLRVIRTIPAGPEPTPAREPLPFVRPSIEPQVAPSTRPAPPPGGQPGPQPGIAPATRPATRPSLQPDEFPQVAPFVLPDNQTVTVAVPQPDRFVSPAPFGMTRQELAPFTQPFQARLPQPQPQPFPAPAPFPMRQFQPALQPMPQVRTFLQPRRITETGVPFLRPPRQGKAGRLGKLRLNLPDLPQFKTRKGDRILIVGWRQGLFEPIVNLETGRVIYPRDVAEIPNIEDARESFTVLVRGKGNPRSRKLDMGVTDAFVKPELRGLSFRADKAEANKGRAKKRQRKAKRETSQRLSTTR